MLWSSYLLLGPPVLMLLCVLLQQALALLAFFTQKVRIRRLRGRAEDAAELEADPEHAPLALALRYGRTFRLHLSGTWRGYFGRREVVATCEPALVRELLNNKAHSQFRAPRYRQVRTMVVALLVLLLLLLLLLLPLLLLLLLLLLLALTSRCHGRGW